MFSEWDSALLAAFAVKVNRGGAVEMHIAYAQRSDLGDAGSGIVHDPKQDLVAVAGPGGGIGGVDIWGQSNNSIDSLLE
jgi:hypothetical protein